MCMYICIHIELHIYIYIHIHIQHSSTYSSNIYNIVHIQSGHGAGAWGDYV